MAATLGTISSISLGIPTSGHPAFLVLWWISNEDSLPPTPCHGFLAHAVSLYLSIATGLVHVQGTREQPMHCWVWFSAGALQMPVVVYSWAQDSPNQRLSKGQRNKGSFPREELWKAEIYIAFCGWKIAIWLLQSNTLQDRSLGSLVIHFLCHLLP